MWSPTFLTAFALLDLGLRVFGMRVVCEVTTSGCLPPQCGHSARCKNSKCTTPLEPAGGTRHSPCVTVCNMKKHKTAAQLAEEQKLKEIQHQAASETPTIVSDVPPPTSARSISPPTILALLSQNFDVAICTVVTLTVLFKLVAAVP